MNEGPVDSHVNLAPLQIRIEATIMVMIQMQSNSTDRLPRIIAEKGKYFQNLMIFQQSYWRLIIRYCILHITHYIGSPVLLACESFLTVLVRFFNSMTTSGTVVAVSMIVQFPSVSDAGVELSPGFIVPG